MLEHTFAEISTIFIHVVNKICFNTDVTKDKNKLSLSNQEMYMKFQQSLILGSKIDGKKNRDDWSPLK